MGGACAGAYLSEGPVQPRALEHTVRFVHDLDRARNIGDISAQVLRHASEIGAEHVIAGTIPGAGPRRQQLSQALFGNWPVEWLNRYVSRGYVLKDSIILHAKSNAAPFFWDELDPIVEADPQARLIMGEAREFNLVGGFSAAIPTLDGQTIGFSIGGRHFEIDPEKRGVLTLIACCAVGRAIALQQESSTKSKNVTLSPREREALQWAAEGKGDWEIGEVMNISEHGADKHLRSIRTKLGAINRTQAVAEAIRRGLIA
jgi:LuxR family transcriptional regulator, quorum-sensing system regulator BjaR1